MMANRNAYQDLYGDVYQALYYAEGEYRVVSWALYQAVYQAVDNAVYRVVVEAMAPCEEPPPPGLELYLGSVT